MMNEANYSIGDVRVSGGPITEKMKVEIFDGDDWLPLRCVIKIEFSANAGEMPRLVLHIETAFLHTLTSAEMVAFNLAGANKKE
jgi:hypothetical protein